MLGRVATTVLAALGRDPARGCACRGARSAEAGVVVRDRNVLGVIRGGGGSVVRRRLCGILVLLLGLAGLALVRLAGLLASFLGRRFLPVDTSQQRHLLVAREPVPAHPLALSMLVHVERINDLVVLVQVGVGRQALEDTLPSVLLALELVVVCRQRAQGANIRLKCSISAVVSAVPPCCRRHLPSGWLYASSVCVSGVEW